MAPSAFSSLNAISTRFPLGPIWPPGKLILIAGATLLLISQPAWALHAIGGRTPANFFEGFLSGLAHPMIGLDHFAFVVAIGLLAVLSRGGMMWPIAFVLATLAGTGLHLQAVDLPGAEAVVALSMLAIGGSLAFHKDLPPLLGALLVAIAGLFHGYAYGESIVGAEMTPLVAYLAGFALIQLVVAIAIFMGGRVWLARANAQPTFRFTGLTIVGVGLAFLGTAILG